MDEPVRDWMNPEWASVRFRYSGDTLGGFVGQNCATFRQRILSGRPVLPGLLRRVHARIASIGFLPVGWSMFIDEPADQLGRSARRCLAGQDAGSFCRHDAGSGIGAKS
jgi:hypothetical protein